MNEGLPSLQETLQQTRGEKEDRQDTGVARRAAGQGRGVFLRALESGRGRWTRTGDATPARRRRNAELKRADSLANPRKRSCICPVPVTAAQAKSTAATTRAMYVVDAPPPACYRAWQSAAQERLSCTPSPTAHRRRPPPASNVPVATAGLLLRPKTLAHPRRLPGHPPTHRTPEAIGSGFSLTAIDKLFAAGLPFGCCTIALMLRWPLLLRRCHGGSAPLCCRRRAASPLQSLQPHGPKIDWRLHLIAHPEVCSFAH